MNFCKTKTMNDILPVCLSKTMALIQKLPIMKLTVVSEVELICQRLNIRVKEFVQARQPKTPTELAHYLKNLENISVYRSSIQHSPDGSVRRESAHFQEFEETCDYYGIKGHKKDNCRKAQKH